MLSERAWCCAQGLLATRPAVIPGTNVIPDNVVRKAWYERVINAMRVHGIGGKDIKAFCDIAGVPD